MRRRMKLRLSCTLAFIWATFILMVLSGCMTVTDKQTIVESTNSSKVFGGQNIAILPVDTQKSLSTDSAISLRRDINKRLGPALQKKIPTARILDVAIVTDQLNKKKAIAIYEQLLSTYEKIGVIDIQKANALGRALGSGYLLISRLKSEKMDLVIMRSLGASLETMIVGADTGKIYWGGTGDWKRGGIFGAGKTSSEEVAESMVNLAFESLQK
jgi:hypothetical protein